MRDAKRSIGAAAVAAVVSSGCATSPSVNVLGAYFPDWMFCIIAGVVLTVAAHLVLQRAQAGQRLGHPAVVYPSLVTLLALVTWLIFFQH